MSSKKTDGRPPKKGGVNKPSPSAGKSTANRKIQNNSKNYNNGKYPVRHQPPKNKNSAVDSRPKKGPKNTKAAENGYLDGKKKYKPVKSPEIEKKYELDDENDEIYEPVSQADIDVEASDFLNRSKKKNTVQKEYVKPLTPAKEPISPYRRKLKRILFYSVTLVVVSLICFLLSVTVFFKIDEIKVDGKTRYNIDDIISSCEINKGDNLILCNTSNGEKSIAKKFPYIEDVSIEKQLFNKIIIKVTEAVPTFIIESGGDYIVLSKSGKIIEINDKKMYNVPTVLGAKLKNVELSSTVKFSDDNIKNYIDEINKSVTENKIKNIETIDISNLSKITLIRKNGFKIIIGNPENIDYKIRTAKIIISQNVSDKDVGTLDVSLASADGGKSYLKSESSVEESSKPKSLESSAPKKTESSAAAEESKETSEEQTSVESEQSDTSENTDEYTDDGDTDNGYTDDGYTDDGYTDDGYTDDGYTDDGYTDDGYTDDGYTDDGYTDDGYTDDGYTDDGYTDDGYTDDGYTDDYTEDVYTEDVYTDDGYADEGYTD